MNAIFLYVGSELLTGTLWRVIRVGDPPVSGSEWIYSHAFLPWAEPINASLAYAAANVLFWYLVAAILYRRRLFLKVRSQSRIAKREAVLTRPCRTATIAAFPSSIPARHR